MKRLYCIFLLSMMIFTSCNTKNVDTVYVTNNELEKEHKEDLDFEVGPIESEVIELYYDGEREFEILFEIWNEGELILSSTRLSEIRLDKTIELAFIVEERNTDEFSVHIEYISDVYNYSTIFPIEGAKKTLTGRTESVYMDTVDFKESDEILLWGYHLFQDEFDFEDGTTSLFENTEWSIGFKLKAMN